MNGGPIEVKPVLPGSTMIRVAAKGGSNTMADHLIGVSRDSTLGWATRFDERAPCQRPHADQWPAPTGVQRKHCARGRKRAVRPHA
jgi:hypothetical protein